jgi:hypothetical protein
MLSQIAALLPLCARARGATFPRKLWPDFLSTEALEHCSKFAREQEEQWRSVSVVQGRSIIVVQGCSAALPLCIPFSLL